MMEVIHQMMVNHLAKVPLLQVLKQSQLQTNKEKLVSASVIIFAIPIDIFSILVTNLVANPIIGIVSCPGLTHCVE